MIAGAHPNITRQPITHKERTLPAVINNTAHKTVFSLQNFAPPDKQHCLTGGGLKLANYMKACKVHFFN